MFKAITMILALACLSACANQPKAKPSAHSTRLVSGPSREFSASETIELRIHVDSISKRARYGIGLGDAKAEAFTWVDGPTLAELMAGAPKYTVYQVTLAGIIDALLAAYQARPRAGVISVIAWKDENPELGFVTLALDAAASFNLRLEKASEEGAGLEITATEK